MGTEKKTEPENTQARLDRKFSQQRMTQLLQMARELTNIAKTACEELLPGYRAIDDAIDALIIEEARFQEAIMQEKLDEPTNKKRQPTLNVHLEIAVNAYDEAQEAVEFANKIQKEYSCHCTLSVKIT